MSDVETGDSVPNKESIWDYKEFLVVVPLLGSALAVTSDVGYFYGLDLSFFSFFSLTEHIVFAIEALPLALTVAIVFSLYATNLVVPWNKFVTGKRFYDSKHFLLALCIVLISILIILLYIAYIRFGVLFLITSILMCITGFIVKFSQSRIISTILTSTLALLAASFFCGALLGVNSLHPSPYKYVVTNNNNEAISAKIIRSGDKGVLYFDRKDKTLVFERWEGIREISAAPN
jgi:hypothetical protein